MYKSTLLIATTLLCLSNIGFAKGSWDIVISQNQDGFYIAKLENTYSQYYNESVLGQFKTYAQAQSAALQTRLKIAASGAHAKPADCFFQSDLLASSDENTKLSLE